MIYIKVNDNLYPASISGKMSDKEWDGRESKAITLEADFATVNALFPDGVAWSIVSEETIPVINDQGEPVLDDEGNPIYEVRQTEFGNSEFCIRGDLTVHVDGTCAVKMGKATDLENAYETLYGGM